MDLEATSLEPLPGGWSGQTFLADVAGERVVARIYPPTGSRGETAPEIDAAVLRLVRGLVPVPEVLEVRRGDRGGDVPGLLVTAYLPGERADLLLARVSPRSRRRVGRLFGDLVADLGGMPMPRPGAFVDASLDVEDFGFEGLPGFVASHVAALAGRWSRSALRSLESLAQDAQDALETVTRTCLVHSDLSPKNLLVDPGRMALSGVLDWEFAHAGHPFTDLGNLLRFERQPAFADAVLGRYVDRRGGNPADALDLARAADLYALVELAARAGQNPVGTRADALLRAIVDSGDLHAFPDPSG